MGYLPDLVDGKLEDVDIENQTLKPIIALLTPGRRTLCNRRICEGYSVKEALLSVGVKVCK